MYRRDGKANSDSSPALANAILVALATHSNQQVRDLASGYTDLEIGAIALKTPAVLQIIARMVIDEALKEIDCTDRGSVPTEIAALATKLRQATITKQVLNEY